MKGDFLMMLPNPDPGAAEEAYLGAIDKARLREQRLAELRAQTGLVSLRRKMGRVADGREELAALYATFNDGFDEFDLVRAKELLGTP
jgi:hypothetical protein